MPHANAHRLLCRAVADEMRQLSALVGDVAETLGGDEANLIHHPAAFQAFDLIVQTMSESAVVLESIALGAASEEIIGVVRLDAIKARLAQALKAA